jgi:hypothetical protein
MPGVTRAEASPIPEPSRENDVLLRVWGSITEGEVRAWCESRIGAYKQPTTVEIL